MFDTTYVLILTLVLVGCVAVTNTFATLRFVHMVRSVPFEWTSLDALKQHAGNRSIFILWPLFRPGRELLFRGIQPLRHGVSYYGLFLRLKVEDVLELSAVYGLLNARGLLEHERKWQGTAATLLTAAGKLIERLSNTSFAEQAGLASEGNELAIQSKEVVAQIARDDGPREYRQTDAGSFRRAVVTLAKRHSAT